MNDVNFSMANGVIAYDITTKRMSSEETALGIPLSGDYYYNFLNSKVKLTELGLYILDTIKCDHYESNSPFPNHQMSSDDPRRSSPISWSGQVSFETSQGILIWKYNYPNVVGAIQIMFLGHKTVPTN